MTLMLAILVLVLGVLAAPPADASTTTSGTITVDCAGARYQGTVGEGELGRLQQRLHFGDFQAPLVQDDTILLPPGPFDVTIPWVTTPDGWAYRVAISASDDGGANWIGVAVEEAFLFCVPPPGNEGCTPGYWKNHLEDWPPTGLSPADDFDTIFGVDLFDPDITLDDAVNAKGGGVKKLARHGTAALLSAAHPDVAYPLSIGAVIAAVQAGEVGPLVEANELGCLIP